MDELVLFRQIPIPSWVMDVETLRFLAVNEACIAQYGYTLDEFMTMHLGDIFPHADLCPTDLTQPMPTHRQWHHHREGHLFEVEVASNAIIYAQRPALLCTLQIVSNPTQLDQDDIQRLQNALDKEVQLRDWRRQFIHVLAHELRHPLAVIKTAVDMLETYRDKLSNEKRSEQYHKIDRQVARLVEIADYAIAKFESEETGEAFRDDVLDLSAICQDALDEVTDYTLMTVHELRYVMPSAVSLLVRGDARLLKRALGNLLKNAVKYSPNGGVVELGVKPDMDMNHIWVRDEGIGIPQADLPHIFEEFRRASNVGGIIGTGLGLAIVSQVAHLHGGTVHIESTEGVGTTVHLLLPRYTH